ncbi:MAG: restriction endonuclease [Candidatus Doudnabacteria bacterium]|nr:restriction endonuclease [Candidatus Doudnabacteria bacterium]
MDIYNFLNLSSIEFEVLSRDLLQKFLNIRLESFIAGRDGGIDLRCYQDKEETIIVQCKRYENYNSLISNIKKEAGKAIKLKPKRYILTTSSPLSRKQKQTIFDLCKPIIISPNDIFSRSDLNNLLGKFPDVEKRHFKLWLSSTSILEKLVQSKVYNQSSFEEESIKENIKVYVENDSYNEALEILSKKKYVIISGIPGIGKTTLARILVYHFLANDFEDFVYLSDNIGEGYKALNPERKQIFLFDDFLGTNFLENKISNNEDERIIKFIDLVNKSKNKILILTTREYILNQALVNYERLDNKNLQLAKCILDLSKYNKLVKSRILYNHLYFSNISKPYIENILEDKNYMGIINHPNYNPRIIETITNPSIWENIKPLKFFDKFINYLDNPELIWKHSYEKQITNFSKCLLMVLLSMGGPALFEDLKEAFIKFAQKYSKKYNFTFNSFSLKDSIKELENTFISSKRDGRGQIYIDFQNPSIKDFLLNYLKRDSDLVDDLITNVIFLNQFFTVFSVNEESNEKIILSKKQVKTIKENIKNGLSDFKISHLIRTVHSFSADAIYYWARRSTSILYKLKLAINNLSLNEDLEWQNFVFKIFGHIEYNKIKGEDKNFYIDILEIIAPFTKFDKTGIVDFFSKTMESIEDVKYFIKFAEIFPEEYKKIKLSDEIKSSINDILENEIDYVSEGSYEDLKTDFREISEELEVDIKEIEKQLEHKVHELENEKYVDIDPEDYRTSSSTDSSEYKQIDDMFYSLKEKF